MEKTEIIAKLQKAIAEEILNLPQKKIDPNEPLISSGLIDSFSLVDLAMLVEDAFNVRIEDTELNTDTFDTLTQLADIVASRI
jgi:acyl carrier protein